MVCLIQDTINWNAHRNGNCYIKSMGFNMNPIDKYKDFMKENTPILYYKNENKKLIMKILISCLAVLLMMITRNIF